MDQPVVALCSLNARYTHTNLALRYLQTYIREQWPQAPRVLLAEWTINEQQLVIVRRLVALAADVYAFSCYIWNIAETRQICRQLKKIRPDALIVWGGPEVSHAAVDRLEADPAVDLIVCGEGEAVFLNLLQHLFPEGRADAGNKAGQAIVRDPGGIRGLAWRDPDAAGKIRVNQAAPLLTGAEWPFPYTTAELASLRDRIVYYETSRGCPFSCAYCLSALDRTVRHRPLPLVFRELDLLIAAGLQQVKLVDRTFNCRPDRALQIWQYLLDRRAMAGRTNFHFEIAGDLLDDQAVDLLNEAPPGLFQLEIGVQTIHPDVLRAINRPSDLDRLQHQVRRLRQAGRVHLHLDLIAGLPGESLDQFSRSLDWIWQLRPQQLQLGFLKVLPGSPMLELAAARGFLWQDDPPYEILQSDAMSFADLAFLKTIEQVIGLFSNSGLFSRSLPWLASRWPRPWLFLAELAVWAGRGGWLDRSLGQEERSQLLWQFSLAAMPDLAAGSWLSRAFLGLLRLDYQDGGQKDQPAWLDFWENQTGPDAGEELRRQRRLVRERHPGSRRFRIDRYCFDWDCWQTSGELRPASWQVCWDLSGNLPAVLDSSPARAI